MFPHFDDNDRLIFLRDVAAFEPQIGKASVSQDKAFDPLEAEQTIKLLKQVSQILQGIREKSAQD